MSLKTVRKLLVILPVAACAVAASVTVSPFIFPVYRSHVRRVKETILREDLEQMRRALRGFSTDRGRRPHTLQELQAGGYLRAIPVDPFTESAETWLIERGQGDKGQGDATGIVNVRSGADGEGTDGVTYREY